MDILIADDNPVFRDVLAAMLRQWGYEVLVAGDGETAWRLLQAADAPRLVILDWMMPGLDGLEVCRRVRGIGRSAYIVILTSKTDPADVAEMRAAGADHYLAKPLRSAELRRRLLDGFLHAADDDRVLPGERHDEPTS